MHKMQRKFYLKSILSVLFIVCIFTKPHFVYAQCTVEYFEDGTLIDSFPTEETSKTEAAAVELIIYDIGRSPSTCEPLPEDIICAEGCCEYTLCDAPFDFLACTDGLYQVTRPIPDPWIASWDVVCDPPSASQIPTLSEWGMIIFMTIILGIGVVTILRRRMS